MPDTTPRTWYVVLTVRAGTVVYAGTSSQLAAEHLAPGTVFGRGGTVGDAQEAAVRARMQQQLVGGAK